MALPYRIQDRLDGITNLPTLPQVAVRLMNCVNDPTMSVRRASAVIAEDMSLSSKVLRLANSAFYGIPRSITTITNAVVILGLKVITTLVVSVTVFDMFQGSKGSSSFNLNAFWRHCLGCGIIARLLTSKIGKFISFDPETAFCAALLHDLGKVVMEQYLHDDFHSAIESACANNCGIYDAEMMKLGYSHTEIAEYLTTDWNLPLDIRLPMIFHHCPQGAAEHLDIVALCHYADYLCYCTNLRVDELHPPPRLDEECIQRLCLPNIDNELLRALCEEELEKSAVLYDLQQ